MGFCRSDGHGHGRAPGDATEEAGHALAHARAVVVICGVLFFYVVVRVFIEAVPGVYSLKVSVNMDARATVQKGRGAHMGVRRSGASSHPRPLIIARTGDRSLASRRRPAVRHPPSHRADAAKGTASRRKRGDEMSLVEHVIKQQ